MQSSTRPSHLRRWPQRLVLWMLLLAVPAYGTSGVLLAMLGAQHRHVETAGGAPAAPQATPHGVAAWLPTAALALIERSHAQLQLLQHAVAGSAHAHEHRHGLFERHHHATNQADVEVIGADDRGEIAGDGPAGGSLLPLGPPASTPRLQPQVRRSRRCVAPPPRWRNCHRRRMERPPRAG